MRIRKECEKEGEDDGEGQSAEERERRLGAAAATATGAATPAHTREKRLLARDEVVAAVQFGRFLAEATRFGFAILHEILVGLDLGLDVVGAHFAGQPVDQLGRVS